MKVDLRLAEGKCVVTREPGDRLPHAGGWSTAEANFYHHVKVALKRQGHDVITRRMWRDGHMYGDDTLRYVRERKHRFYVYDGNYAIRDVVQEYKEEGSVTLLVQDNGEPTPRKRRAKGKDHVPSTT